jgi:hypothetical protein
MLLLANSVAGFPRKATEGLISPCQQKTKTFDSCILLPESKVRDYSVDYPSHCTDAMELTSVAG